MLHDTMLLDTMAARLRVDALCITVDVCNQHVAYAPRVDVNTCGMSQECHYNCA